MEIAHELVRSASDAYPDSESPGSLSRGEGRKPRAISLVHQYHAEHKARLARMGGPCQITHPGNVEAALKLIEAPAFIEAPIELPAIIPCYPVIPKLTVEQQKQLTLKDIQEAVAKSFGLTRGELISDQRTGRIVRPRQIAIYLAMKRTPYGTVTVGRLFGNKDHTTVIHSCRRAKAMMEYDPALKARVDAIEARLLS